MEEKNYNDIIYEESNEESETSVFLDIQYEAQFDDIRYIDDNSKIDGDDETGCF